MLDKLEKLLPYLKANHTSNNSIVLALDIITDKILDEYNAPDYFDWYWNILDRDTNEFKEFNNDIDKFSWLRILRDGNYNKPKDVSDIAYDDLMEEVRKYHDNNNNELS